MVIPKKYWNAKTLHYLAIKTKGMKLLLSVFFSMLFFSMALAQESDYDAIKKEKLSKKSPFEQIVDRVLLATIEYEDDEIIAFIPLRLQAPVHILIVPKK